MTCEILPCFMTMICETLLCFMTMIYETPPCFMTMICETITCFMTMFCETLPCFMLSETLPCFMTIFYETLHCFTDSQPQLSTQNVLTSCSTAAAFVLIVSFGTDVRQRGRDSWLMSAYFCRVLSPACLSHHAQSELKTGVRLIMTVSSTATGYAGLSWLCFPASLCQPVESLPAVGGGDGRERERERERLTGCVKRIYIYVFIFCDQEP